MRAKPGADQLKTLLNYSEFFGNVSASSTVIVDNFIHFKALLFYEVNTAGLLFLVILLLGLFFHILVQVSYFLVLNSGLVFRTSFSGYLFSKEIRFLALNQRLTSLYQLANFLSRSGVFLILMYSNFANYL